MKAHAARRHRHPRSAAGGAAASCWSGWWCWGCSPARAARALTGRWLKSRSGRRNAHRLRRDRGRPALGPRPGPAGPPRALAGGRAGHRLRLRVRAGDRPHRAGRRDGIRGQEPVREAGDRCRAPRGPAAGRRAGGHHGAGQHRRAGHAAVDHAGRRFAGGRAGVAGDAGQLLRRSLPAGRPAGARRRLHQDRRGRAARATSNPSAGGPRGCARWPTTRSSSPTRSCRRRS